MSTQNPEVQYDVVNGKIVEVFPSQIGTQAVEVVATLSIEPTPEEPKRVSAQRRKYILRGSDTVISIAGENAKQIRNTIETLIDTLDGFVRLGLCKLEYTYECNVNNIPSQASDLYREASPVTRITMEVKRVAGSFFLFINLHEIKGHKEQVMIRSFEPAIENVITGLRISSQRLAGK